MLSRGHEINSFAILLSAHKLQPEDVNALIEIRTRDTFSVLAYVYSELHDASSKVSEYIECIPRIVHVE
jgi:hypothetical protein